MLSDSNGFEAFFIRLEKSMSVMFGDFSLEEYRLEKHWSRLQVVLILLYVMIVTLILINMLVAKMGDTFARISEQAERSWLLERARVIVSIEKEMSRNERYSDKNKYWVMNETGKRCFQISEVNHDVWKTDE